MKKTNILILILIFSLFKSQCTIGDLTLGLLGKSKYDAKNILYGNKNIFDIKEDNLVFEVDFGYLTKKHKQSFLDFTHAGASVTLVSALRNEI